MCAEADRDDEGLPPGYCGEHPIDRRHGGPLLHSGLPGDPPGPPDRRHLRQEHHGQQRVHERNADGECGGSSQVHGCCQWGRPVARLHCSCRCGFSRNIYISLSIYGGHIPGRNMNSSSVLACLAFASPYSVSFFIFFSFPFFSFFSYVFLLSCSVMFYLVYFPSFLSLLYFCFDWSGLVWFGFGLVS